ncbi:MAG: NAD(P)H-binding protein [Bacteroidota bacterium]|nr:NAD(P)H-binding protein [Bacteroidota bacterium]
MKIIVTGSLGHMSKPLTEQLIKEEHAVIVVSSSDERKKEIEVLGAKAAIGSLEDGAFVTETFKGADAVYCMIPPSFAASDQLAYYKKIAKNYKEAIIKNGIKRVIHLSSWGADLSEGTGMILGSHHVEVILDSIANTAVTHLRAGSLMYNLYSFTSMIKNAGMIAANYGGDDKITWVHHNDIAKVAAEELIKTSDTQKVRYVASDEKTANESAEIIGATIGKPGLQWKLITDEQEKENLLKHGVPEPIADNIVNMFRSIHNGKLVEDYEKNKPELGKTKLQDFAKEFAAAYNYS